MSETLKDPHGNDILTRSAIKQGQANLAQLPVVSENNMLNTGSGSWVKRNLVHCITVSHWRPGLTILFGRASIDFHGILLTGIKDRYATITNNFVQ
jgi:hypothetical protein